MARWRRFLENAGKLGVVRTVVVGLAVVGFAAGGPLASPDLWPLPLGALLGAILPWQARGALVKHLETSLKLHRLSGFAILVALALARDWLKAAPPLVAAACLGALAAYLSVYVAVLSDPEVVTVASPPAPGAKR